MTLKEMIAVMQSAEDGAEIEQYDYRSEVWYACYCPNWNWSDNDYRVKPKPRECWINFFGSAPSSVSWESEEEARNSAYPADGSPPATQVHFREVIE